MPSDTIATPLASAPETSQSAPFVGRLDRRTSRAKRYEEALQGYVSDRGGPERLSHAEYALCTQAAGLETLCREFVTDHLAGREVDTELWLQAVGHFGRLVSKLGLQRIGRDVTPSLRDIIEGELEDDNA